MTTDRAELRREPESDEEAAWRQVSALLESDPIPRNVVHLLLNDIFAKFGENIIAGLGQHLERHFDIELLDQKTRGEAEAEARRLFYMQCEKLHLQIDGIIDRAIERRVVSH